MKTIEEIQSELRALAHELDQLKESRSAGEREIDFGRLSIDGSHKPITPHPLRKFDNYAQKSYLTMLLTMARFEEDRLPASLLFAHRIAFRMGYLQKGGNLQSEYIAAQTLSYKQLDDLVELFKGTDERLMLILECMLTAGAFDRGKKDAIDYIVQLSQLLELSRDDLIFLSNMAAVILTQDLNAYECDIRNKYEVFNCYLKSFGFTVNVVMEKAISNYNEDMEKVRKELASSNNFMTRAMSGMVEPIGALNSLLAWRRCDYIHLEKDVLNYKYNNSPKIYSQIVGKDFILLAETNEIKPNCPVGVEAHPLTPFSIIKRNYNEAWIAFQKDHQ